MAVALLGSFAALYWMTPAIMERLRNSLQHWLSQSTEESTLRALSLDHLHLILRQIGVDVFIMIGPVVAGIAVVGVGANLMQTGFLWRKDGLSVDWSRISPMSGEMTTVTPSRHSAGNWKQRDFPPPVGMIASLLRP